MDVVPRALPRQRRLSLRIIPLGISFAYNSLLILLLLLRLLRITNPFILTLLISMTPFLFIFLPVSLALALLARSRITLAMGGILSIIAAFWLGGIFLPRAAAQAVDEPISFVVINASAKDLARVTVEPWINSRPADIVLMQETYMVRLTPGLEDLRESYPYQAIQTTSLNYRGNSTLSIYPIEEANQEGFEQTSAFTRVVIDINGTRVAVYNVSLDAPVSGGSMQSPLSLLSHYDTALRDQQLDALLDRLESETLPTVVGGEFNLTEFDPAYNRLADVLTDSFREAGTGMGFTFPARGAYALNGMLRPIMRLDYLWHNRSFRSISAVVGDDVGSDRLPIIVQVEFDDE